jgi:hypothetical protein
MLHFGHVPRFFDLTSGCIGQAYVTDDGDDFLCEDCACAVAEVVETTPAEQASATTSEVTKVSDLLFIFISP